MPSCRSPGSQSVCGACGPQGRYRDLALSSLPSNMHLAIALLPLALALKEWDRKPPEFLAPLRMNVDADLPELGFGTLEVTFSKGEPDFTADYFVEVDATLVQAFRDHPELAEYGSVETCYHRSNHKHYICKCYGSKFTTMMAFFIPGDKRRLQACDPSCRLCPIDSPTNCTTCSRNYKPYTILPGRCVADCDESCDTCLHSATFCSACAEGYKPLYRLPGLCTSGCHKSCQTCGDTGKICQECTPGYSPVTDLPGHCYLVCDETCTHCVDEKSNCLACSEGYVIRDLLPGPCITSCHPSCLTCHRFSNVCKECAPGFHPQAKLPGECIAN